MVGDNELIARSSRDCLADNSFGSIGLRRVDKVDAQIDRLSDNSDGTLLRVRVVAQSKAAGAAATKADHAYFESGFPKGCVFHRGFLSRFELLTLESTTFSRVAP